jgi:hypothetical protein
MEIYTPDYVPSALQSGTIYVLDSTPRRVRPKPPLGFAMKPCPPKKGKKR